MIEQWNEIEEKFSNDLKTCRTAADLPNCFQFEELQFFIRHYQQKSIFQKERLENSEYEFVITEDDLKDSSLEYNDLFQEIPDPEDREITTFFECFGAGDDNNESRNIEDATDEEFGDFLVKQLKAIECKEEKLKIKRDILKMF